MLIGPVFRAELLRTARQRRYYALRLVYGLVLLLIIWTRYERMRLANPLAYLSAFARDTFAAFAEVQLATLLLLVPAVFGGAIADEKQRKTLHYLMASQLSSGEIIVDKVLGRSAHLAVFVAIGLPIVSLLGLFGGISLGSVVVAYVGTSSTVAFAIAMTVLVSTLARRVRDAVLSSSILVLMWLLLPSMILFFGSWLRPGAYFWIKPVNDWLVDMTPSSLWLRSRFFSVLGLTAPSMVAQFLWMVGLQLAGASVLLLLAIWRLRPTFRRQEEIPANRNRRRPRGFARADCGDDPVAWKERYFAPADPFTRPLLLPAIVVVTIPLAFLTYPPIHQVIANLWRVGFISLNTRPDSFLLSLQVDLAWCIGFWLAAVAMAAASSVAIEREQETWDSLTATPLTGRDLLRGKVRGAIARHRGFVPVMILLWAGALIARAAHPMGVLASIALTALMTWFVATVGVYASLRTPTTSRATTATLATLAFFNGYPFLLFLWLIGAIDWQSAYPWVGFLPTFPAWAMASGPMIERAWEIIRMPGDPVPIGWVLVGLALAGLFIYIGTAISLTRRVIGEIDARHDRTPGPAPPGNAPAPPRPLEEVTAR